MKYTDQKSRTVYETVTVEVADDVTYFHSFDVDGDPDYYYKLELVKEKGFDTLYNIKVTTILNYEDEYFIKFREDSDCELPRSVRGYFSGQEKMKIITEEQFEEVKQTVKNKL